jgi:hypothetical protein
MPDNDKTTNTNQPITEEVPTVGQTDPTTTPPPPATTPDTSGQIIDTPPPPPMEDGAVSPPPPIIEEKKSEETAAVTQEAGATENAQAIPDIPPVITTSGTGGKKPVGKKMIATILGILVLVGGIGAGVILVQNQQDIREKADTDVCIYNSDCDVGKICQNNACVDGPSECLTVGAYGCNSTTNCCSGLECTNRKCVDEDEEEPIPTTCTSSSKVTRTGNDAGGNNATEFKVTQAQLVACHAACPSAYLVVYRYECDRVTNLSGGCNDNGVLVKSHAQPGNEWSIRNITCGSVQMDVGCFDLSRAYGSLSFASYSDNQPCDPEPSVPGISCSCLNIKAFDDEWNEITNLSSLVVGDVVRFTVAGTATSGSIDKARFTINESLGAEITAKRPGTDEFFVEYTIPEGVSSFTINAEIHHATVGWF